MNIKNIIFSKSYKNIQAFGLDISDSSIKIAQLKKSNNGARLISHNRVSVPPGIIEEGEIIKDQELIDLIRKTTKEIKGKKLRSNYAVCSLPEQHSFIKIIRMPKMTMAELETAIKWEAEANIPFPSNEVYMDWQIIRQEQGHADHFDILINAVPKKIIDRYLGVLRKADIEPIVFETESIASIRSLIKNEFTDKPVLIIDLGFNRTSFNIFSGHSIRFTSSIPISNNQMIKEIADQMKISWEEAKVLKFKIGLDKNKDNGKIFNILLPVLTKLVESIKDCASFYEQHDEHQKDCLDRISKVILCGGGANLSGIAEYLSLWLKLPVVLGNPWVNILCSSKRKPTSCLNELKFPEFSYEESLSYSTVLGLALRGINSKNI